MTFWSSQTLEANLSDLVGHEETEMVDCNAITLRVGDEIYITPSLDQASPSTHTKKQLGVGESFAIPPGQFGFILTQEVVSLPRDTMGFISLKATFKMRGLINVSGFHVDPGFNGQLIYSVFNAGPAPVHLQRGMSLFLLWVSSLDASSKKHKTEIGPDHIPPTMINNITGVLDSIFEVQKRIAAQIDDLKVTDQTLKDEMHRLDRSVDDKLYKVSTRQHVIRIFINVTAALVLVGVGAALRSFFK